MRIINALKYQIIHQIIYMIWYFRSKTKPLKSSNFKGFCLVEHRGVEPLASTMRMSRATNCDFWNSLNPYKNRVPSLLLPNCDNAFILQNSIIQEELPESTHSHFLNLASMLCILMNNRYQCLQLQITRCTVFR